MAIRSLLTMYSIKEILVLVAVQYSNAQVKELAELLTEEECSSRILSRENQEALGLKSPKLSKALAKLGLSQKVVSQALASANLEDIPRVSADVGDLLEMGDSVHYKSCQRKGSGLRTVEELVPFLGKSLWLYVVGERKSINGSGFRARRLLRMMYHDAGCTKPAGVYLEHVYGDPSLLPNEEVQRFFGLPLLVPRYEKQVTLFCPSAEYGYNDTLARGVEQNMYQSVEGSIRSIIWEAYEQRPRLGGVYLYSLKENTYNPQNAKFRAFPSERKWRGFLDYNQRALIRAWISIFGYPQERFETSEIHCTSEIKGVKPEVQFWYTGAGITDYRRFHFGTYNQYGERDVFLDKLPGRMEVKRNLPALGFYKPVDIAPMKVCMLFGFCPLDTEAIFYHRDIAIKVEREGEKVYFCATMYNELSMSFVYTKVVKIEDHSIEVLLDYPVFGLYKAETAEKVHLVEDEEYVIENSDYKYWKVTTVVRDNPQLGYAKAIPIINWRVKGTNLWVTGELPFPRRRKKEKVKVYPQAFVRVSNPNDPDNIPF